MKMIIPENTLREEFGFETVINNYRDWKYEIVDGEYGFVYYVSCPCNGHGCKMWIVNQIPLGKEKEISREKLEYAMEDASDKILRHLHNRIRLDASPIHIELLVKILGVTQARKLLQEWASKNMIVAMALREYIERLTEEECTQSGA